MSYTKNCFFKFEDCGKDDENSIFNRTKGLNTNKFSKFNEFTKKMQNLKKVKNNDIHQQVVSSIKQFEFSHLKAYRGELFDITSILLNCLSKISVDLNYTILDKHYLKFINLWENYEFNSQIKDKYLVHHYMVQMIRTVHNNYKHLLNKYLVQKIEKLHYSYLTTNKYTSIKNYFDANKLGYYNNTTDINQNKTILDAIDTKLDNNDDSWEKITTKKGKTGKIPKNNNTLSNEMIQNNKKCEQKIITIIDMGSKYIFTFNQEFDNDFSADIEEIEPDMDFLEYVDSEPDSNYDYSSDDNNEYN
jgi:hypothetical protein